MSHTGMGMEVFAYEAVFEFGYFAFFLVYPQIVIEQGDPGAVIPSVLQSFQAFQNERVSFAWSDISNNAAHSDGFKINQLTGNIIQLCADRKKQPSPSGRAVEKNEMYLREPERFHYLIIVCGPRLPIAVYPYPTVVGVLPVGFHPYFVIGSGGAVAVIGRRGILSAWPVREGRIGRLGHLGPLALAIIAIAATIVVAVTAIVVIAVTAIVVIAVTAIVVIAVTAIIVAVTAIAIIVIAIAIIAVAVIVLLGRRVRRGTVAIGILGIVIVAIGIRRAIRGAVAVIGIAIAVGVSIAITIGPAPAKPPT
jgi:hypothetical protein